MSDCSPDVVRTVPVEVCPACGSRERTPYTIGGNSDLRRCGRCALIYAPEVAAAEDIYVDGYLEGRDEHGFGLDVTHPWFQKYLEFCARERVAWVGRHASPPGRWLDVGCGSGEVLGAVVAAGWDGVGVDPVAASVQWGRTQRPHLDLRSCLLEDSELPRASFDVVSAFHVLEHMTDGVAFLRSVARWARPGGAVVVEVPNIRSGHRFGFGAGWPGLRPLEHVSHFTPRTLAATVRHAGLEPVAVETRSYLWPDGQSVDEALADLGLYRLRRWCGRLGRETTRNGAEVTVPTATGWRMLSLVEGAYRRLGVGQVTLAVARVPR